MSANNLVTGVDFVCVPTRNFERAVEFYGSTLGLPERARWGSMPAAEFQAGNLTLVIMEMAAFGRPHRANAAPIALQVADTDAARARLESLGIEFDGDTIDSGVCHQAFFADADGNPLILHHRYAPQ